jgi:hypothetical protein
MPIEQAFDVLVGHITKPTGPACDFGRRHGVDEVGCDGERSESLNPKGGGRGRGCRTRLGIRR